MMQTRPHSYKHSRRAVRRIMGQTPTTTKTAFLAAAMLFAMPATLFPSMAAASSESTLAATHAERLIIRLINAETGEPMSHQNVQVEWDADAEESLIYVGGKGQGTMEVSPGSSHFSLRAGAKGYRDPNRPGFFNFRRPPPGVPVQQAIHKGFVA